jgi:hypothetical protein
MQKATLSNVAPIERLVEFWGKSKSRMGTGPSHAKISPQSLRHGPWCVGDSCRFDRELVTRFFPQPCCILASYCWIGDDPLGHRRTAAVPPAASSASDKTNHAVCVAVRFSLWHESVQGRRKGMGCIRPGDHLRGTELLAFTPTFFAKETVALAIARIPLMRRITKAGGRLAPPLLK